MGEAMSHRLSPDESWCYTHDGRADQCAAVSPVRETYEQISHPTHYGGDTGYEAIKVIEAWGLGFCLGNALKYISRAGRKPGVDAAVDLRKAVWYIQREIARLSKGSPS